MLATRLGSVKPRSRFLTLGAKDAQYKWQTPRAYWKGIEQLLRLIFSIPRNACHAPDAHSLETQLRKEREERGAKDTYG